MTNPILDKLKRGQVLLGLCNMYPAPGIIEVMCRGWDFVWIDGQHGQHQFDSALAAVRTADAMGIASVLRVPGHEHGILGPFCDTAPSMLMVPMVDTPQQARAIVQAVRFPPVGNRSYGGRRPIDLLGRDYHETAEPALMVQIESPQAVEAVEEIAAIEGVDVLFFGAADIKLRLGLPLETPHDDRRIVSAMKRTADAARAAGKYCAAVAESSDTVAAAIELGYQMLVGGGEVKFIRSAAPARLAELRQTAASTRRVPHT